MAERPKCIYLGGGLRGGQHQGFPFSLLVQELRTREWFKR